MILNVMHRTNVYDFRLMVLYVMDCLGFTFPICIVLAPAESTDGVEGTLSM
jgi:hypothetical protein